MISSIKTRGLKQTMKNIDAVPAKFGNKFIRSLLRKTGKDVVLPEIPQAVHSKRAKNNIKIQAIRGEKRAVRIGVSRDAFPEQWLQLGTEERTTKKGSSRGKIMPNNTLEALYERLVDPMLEYVMQNGEKEIKKIFKRTNRGLDRKISRLG
jgi:hypothetical protein